MSGIADTITAEVIHNRLARIGHEGGLVLQRCAVSPTVVEAKDLGFNVSDAEGRTIVYSTWMPRHGTTLSYMLASCRETFAGDIRPGDMYMVNDPHAGALHSLDVAVIAPVFAEGVLAGWVGNAIHHIDIGAMSPGRAPLATDAHQEGITIRGLKLVREGVIDPQVFALFSDNVRMPRHQDMDLRAQISANHSAAEKLRALIGKYGLDAYRAACATSLDLAERAARERIAALPDGHYAYRETLDYDREYALVATLDVRGGALRFDLTGTDPQSATFVNSAAPCTVANMHNILACQLFPDLEVNEGTFRAVDITLPPGTVLSAEFPAPCSGASTLAGWKAQQLVLGLLTQAVLGSPQEFRAQAQWGWAFTEASWSGRDARGRWFSMKGDSTMHGGGARRHTDGIDVANIAGSTNTALPSVESYELRYPVLYLSRGLVPDSEGAGEFRGGLAGEWSRCLFGVAECDELTFYIGRDHGAAGAAGGLPGRPASVEVKRGTDVAALLRDHVPDFDELAGETELLPQQPRSLAGRLGAADVLRVRGMGGGGFGPPGARERDAVLGDVAEGLVSPERAARVYGVE
ncbi:hydantoinase B/oxoprolinase family protein [Streptomyces sp. NPDC050560]|uniref:hydantoinase B/oxoprolinase family protein n=1 Tax=Streptomyces sp. NPDC050560 TaxID=3365630 RepID=UPI0037877AD9